MDVRNIPAPVEEIRPVFKVTPALAVKTVGAFLLSTLGIYYLGAGKKDHDLQKMILGALLVTAGMCLF